MTVRWTRPCAMTKARRLWVQLDQDKGETVNFDAFKKAKESEQKEKRLRRGEDVLI